MKTKTQCSLKLRLIVASLIAEMVKNPPVMQETPGWIPGLGRSPGEGIGYPLQYSGPENSVDYIVHGVAKSRTRLSDFHFHFVAQLVKNRPPSLQAMRGGGAWFPALGWEDPLEKRKATLR